MPNPIPNMENPNLEHMQQKAVFSPIRRRVILLALAIIPLDQYWVLMMEKVRTGPYPTTISIFANAIFILAILVALNKLGKRVFKKDMLSSGEMILVYSMVAIAGALAGHDMMPTLVGAMTYPWQFATQENQWHTTFIPYLPKWLSVTDMKHVQPLWEGRSSLSEHWRAWAMPVFWWVCFITMLGFVMMCINTLVRKSWMEHERLPFPIVQLPLHMTEPDSKLWRSRLFWLGFAIAAGIDVINGLHIYLPLNIPMIEVTHRGQDLTSAIATKPWNALGWTPISFYPFVIGLGYLLRADLLFSCWFFYWYWKLLKVFASTQGLDVIPNFPYTTHQNIGGMVAILLTLSWTGRRYWKQVWQRIIGKPSDLDDSDEPISYRVAFIGAMAGLTGLCVFMNLIGLSIWWGIIAFAIYFVLATTITRIRAELGPPIHDFHFNGPDFMLTSSVGLNGFTNRDFVGLGYFFWFNRAFRSIPMPIGLESMKAAQMTGSNQKRYFWGMMLAIVVGAIATFWAYLYLGYKLGFGSGVNQGGVYASGVVKNLDIWFSRPPDAMHPNWGANVAVVVGFVICSLLWYMHLVVPGWPLHPIGFVITNSYQINLVWMPLFLAWLIKVTILRFGGLRLYRQGLPFFLGLILGEMIIGCLWSIIGLMFNIPYYNFWGQ
ncbi:MAG: DUF6785 family protein [Armatimonadota bacterium]